MRALMTHGLGALRVGVRRRWSDLVLLAGGVQALVWMARPDELVALAGSRALGHDTAFEVATALALGVFALLTLRFLVQLWVTMRRVSFDPALRAEQGTVMAEFALVLPVVMLMLGTVFQVALVANAALVVRYAAFTAARSAMVSFDSDMASLSGGRGPSALGLLNAFRQIRPFPEEVDRTRPEIAAALTLASISPRFGSATESSIGLEGALEANGDSWDGADFAGRVAYAARAMDLVIEREYLASLPPLIPMPEHAVQPGRQRAASPEERERLGYLLPRPEGLRVESMVPEELELIDLDTFKPPAAADAMLSAIGLEIPMPGPISIDLSSLKDLIRPFLQGVDEFLDKLQQGQALAVRTFARSRANVDVFGPKEVEVTLTYDFKLNLPSILQLIPRGLDLTVRAPDGGRAFRIMQKKKPASGPVAFFEREPGDYTVRLQSMGGRSNPLGMVPVVPRLEWDPVANKPTFKAVYNLPLYFPVRGKTQADIAADKAAAAQAEADKAAAAQAAADARAEEEKKRQEELDAQNQLGPGNGSNKMPDIRSSTGTSTVGGGSG